MNVSDAVRTRRSVRAFLDRAVDPALLRELVALAARAPSGGNLQPWRVVVLGGDALGALKAEMRERLASGAPPDPEEYPIYPPNLHEPYRTCRYALGEALYARLGIPRADKAGRARQFERNYALFDAPVGLFCYIDRRMGRAQWSDLGMYLQTLMLLLREHDLDSCPQESWSTYHASVDRHASAPAEWMLFCGMAIGYADPQAPANQLVSERLPLAQFAQFIGI